jgi:hypothetical protein
MEISAIHLIRKGNDTVVLIEQNGNWVEVIREPFDGNFSHIIEKSGIEKAIKNGCEC